MSLHHRKSKNWYTDDNKERNDLTKEHPFGDSGQLVLAVIFLFIWLADSFILRWTVFLQSSIPLYVSLSAGVLIAAAAWYLAAKAHRIVFKEVRRPPEVIEKSVFKLVRHPMYLGALLLYLAFAAATLSLAALVFWFIMFFFYNYIAVYEEKMLEKKFGEQYLAYKHRVARWIPGVW